MPCSPPDATVARTALAPRSAPVDAIKLITPDDDADDEGPEQNSDWTDELDPDRDPLWELPEWEDDEDPQPEHGDFWVELDDGES